MTFDRQQIKIKLKATAIHFFISLAVFLVLAGLVYFVWYPQPYFSVDGGWQGIRIIAAVDLVLGPMMTLVIFNIKKPRKEIITDLTIIAVIQLSALSYGVIVTYNQRPVAVILNDPLAISTVAEIYGDSLKSLDDLQNYSDEKPPIIAMEIPLNRQALDEVMRLEKDQGLMEHAQQQLYLPRQQLAGFIEKSQATMTAILGQRHGQKDFDNWLVENKTTAEQVLLFAFNGRYGFVWLVFDQDGQYLGYF